MAQTENADYLQTLEAAEQRLELAKERQHLAEAKLEQVKRDKSRLRKRLKWQRDGLPPLDDMFAHTLPISEKLLQDAQLSLAIADADYQSIKITHIEASQTIDSIQAQIRDLGDALQEVTLSPLPTSSLKRQIKDLREKLDFQQTLLSIEQNRVKILAQTKTLLSERLDNEEVWSSDLKRVYQIQEEQIHISAMRMLETKLHQEQKEWLVKLAKLNTQLRSLETPDGMRLPSAKQHNLQLDIFRAEEKSNLIQTKMMLIKFTETAQRLHKSLDSHSSTLLRSVNRQALNLISDLEKLVNLHTRKLEVLQLRKKITTEKAQRKELESDEVTRQNKLLDDLINNYQIQNKEVGLLLGKVRGYQNTISRNLTKALARRQGFPEMTLQAWRVMGSKLSRMPGLTTQAFTGLYEQFKIAWSALSQWQFILLIIVECFWFSAWLEGRGLLRKGATALANKRTALFGETMFVLLTLLYRNWTSIIAALMLFTLIFLGGVPFKSFSFFAYLVLVFFVAKLSLGFARITLLEGEEQISGHDVKLYQGMRWFCVGGGLFAAATVLAHQLPVGYHVTDLFNRLSMIFILVFGIFLFRKRKVVPELLMPYVDGHRRYLARLIQMLSWLIPLTMLLNAAVGLLGYVALAWSFAKHAVIFLIVLTGYVLTHGVLIDTMEIVSRYCIRILKNGWLWNEAILKPVDKILRIGLFFAAVFVLFSWYGWDEHSVVVKFLKKALYFKLIQIESEWITPYSIIKAIVTIVVLQWSARWSREFAFRSLFASSRDAGLRNSLSTFFQYSVVIIGAYLGLKVVMGIDIGYFKWLLTGLFIGIGFGLRDMANSFVSGLLMLIERPVRRGDFVAIGGHEGEVTHIGMRAMTIRTWDHIDVLVPNSETFTSSFSNWTRQDNMIRTVITLRIHRHDDPTYVCDLVMKILDDHEDVLNDPPPRILLRELKDDLIELEARYNIHLDSAYTRVRVRSEVLNNIWRMFKQHGIREPYPQHTVHLEQNPGAI